MKLNVKLNMKSSTEPTKSSMTPYFEALQTKLHPDLAYLNHKTFFITGATGLIGSLLVAFLDHLNQTLNYDIKIVALVRDATKAQSLLPASSQITYLVGELQTFTPENLPHINYIIHCAAPTKSQFFIHSPIETLDAIIAGTRHLLDLATTLQPEKFLFLSSMEVYGVLDQSATNKNQSSKNQTSTVNPTNILENQSKVTEDQIGYIDFLQPRSSYSEGKRAAELYCYSYFSERQLPVVIARSAMCFGPGILSNETRAYKAFIDQARQGQDIILKTHGTTKLNYISTLDLINGLLLLLQHGEIGNAYNLCNDDSGQYTILDLANLIATHYHVKTRIQLDPNFGLAPDNTMVLSNQKLKRLGFTPFYTVDKNIAATIHYVETNFPKP